MPLGDVSEQNLILDSLFGAGKAAGMPASHDVALYTGSPYSGGTETDYPGYARVTVNNDATWPAAADGAKTVDVTFPAATDAASDDIAAWVMFNGTAITAWEFLADTVSVDGAGSLEPVGVTVYHPNDDNVTA
jgi:hypothetical protein